MITGWIAFIIGNGIPLLWAGIFLTGNGIAQDENQHNTSINFG
jgi:hypothetical protein